MRAPSSAGLDEEHDPNFQNARKFAAIQQYQTAIGYYEKALAENPRLASAHFEIGLLCDDKLGDPIAAIYHYRRFVELQPDSDKKPMAMDLIEHAKQALATKLSQSNGDDLSVLTRLQDEKAALERENGHLLVSIDELEKKLGIVAAGPVSTNTAINPTLPPPVPVANGRVHNVQKGDTLYSLAQKYYGSKSAWDKIYQANRTVLAKPDLVKVGQQLVIP